MALYDLDPKKLNVTGLGLTLIACLREHDRQTLATLGLDSRVNERLPVGEKPVLTTIDQYRACIDLVRSF